MQFARRYGLINVQLVAILQRRVMGFSVCVLSLTLALLLPYRGLDCCYSSMMMLNVRS